MSSAAWPSPPGGGAGGCDKVQAWAGDNLALRLIEPFSAFKDLLPAPAQGTPLQGLTLHAVDGVQIAGEAGLPLPHPVGAHPPDQAFAGSVAPEVRPSPVFPLLPAIQAGTGQGEPQRAHPIGDEPLPVAGGKFLVQVRPLRQCGLPLRQTAYLPVGSARQGQVGVHFRRPFQVV